MNADVPKPPFYRSSSVEADAFADMFKQKARSCGITIESPGKKSKFRSKSDTSLELNNNYIEDIPSLDIEKEMNELDNGKYNNQSPTKGSLYHIGTNCLPNGDSEPKPVANSESEESFHSAAETIERCRSASPAGIVGNLVLQRLGAVFPTTIPDLKSSKHLDSVLEPTTSDPLVDTNDFPIRKDDICDEEDETESSPFNKLVSNYVSQIINLAVESLSKRSSSQTKCNVISDTKKEEDVVKKMDFLVSVSESNSNFVIELSADSDDDEENDSDEDDDEENDSDEDDDEDGGGDDAGGNCYVINDIVAEETDALESMSCEKLPVPGIRPSTEDCVTKTSTTPYTSSWSTGKISPPLTDTNVGMTLKDKTETFTENISYEVSEKTAFSNLKTGLNPGSPEFRPSLKKFLGSPASNMRIDAPVFMPVNNSNTRYVPVDITPSKLSKSCQTGVKVGANIACNTTTVEYHDTASNTKQKKTLAKSTETVSCDTREICINTIDSVFDEESDYYNPPVIYKDNDMMTDSLQRCNVGCMTKIGVPESCDAETSMDPVPNYKEMLLQTQVCV